MSQKNRQYKTSFSRQISLLNNQITLYKSKYDSLNNFKPLKLTNNNEEFAFDAYRYSLELAFVRTKFVFKGVLDAIKQKNSYTSWTLLKAYWECVAFLGYLVVGVEGFYKNGTTDYDGIIKWLNKNVQCGKNVPSEDYLLNNGFNAEDYRQVNVLTMMDVVSKFITKRYKDQGSNVISSFASVYKNYLGEIGHPNVLGLSFAVSKRKEKWFIRPNNSWSDKNHLDLLRFLVSSSEKFFNFWDYSSVKH